MLFISDENLSDKLCKGLHILESGNLRSPHKVTVQFAPDIMGGIGAMDEDIIPKVGELKGILITQDRDFINKKHYFDLYKEHKVGIVLYTIANKDTYWDKVKSFIKNWEEIKQSVAGTKPPFVFVFGKSGKIEPFRKFH